MHDMHDTTITVVINDTPYRLAANDPESLRSLSPADRGRLIALVEAVKLHTADQGQNTNPQIDLNPPASQPGLTAADAVVQSNTSDVSQGRLGTGDVDALFAKLVMEEKLNSKPPITARSLYPVVIGVALVVILLIVLL